MCQFLFQGSGEPVSVFVVDVKNTSESKVKDLSARSL